MNPKVYFFQLLLFPFLVALPGRGNTQNIVILDEDLEYLEGLEENEVYLIVEYALIKDSLSDIRKIFIVDSIHWKIRKHQLLVRQFQRRICLHEYDDHGAYEVVYSVAPYDVKKTRGAIYQYFYKDKDSTTTGVNNHILNFQRDTISYSTHELTFNPAGLISSHLYTFQDDTKPRFLKTYNYEEDTKNYTVTIRDQEGFEKKVRRCKNFRTITQRYYKTDQKLKSKLAYENYLIYNSRGLLSHRVIETSSLFFEYFTFEAYQDLKSENPEHPIVRLTEILEPEEIGLYNALLEKGNNK